jgi:hypothetical protein
LAFGQPASPITQPFGYNDRSELTSSSRSGTSWAYLYDNIGNRTWSRMWDEPSDPNQTYTANALDQYLQVRLRSTPEQFQSYEYDEDGNLTNVWVAADMNCDGVAGFSDINPFVQAVTNPTAWQAAYPGCDPRVGDINCDGTYGQLSFGDINPFVALLSGGG